MPAEIARVAFRERRRGFIGWILGILLLSAFTFAFFPSIRDSADFSKIVEELPEALQSLVGDKDLTSPEGYLESQLFLYLVPLLLFVYAIGQSADAIAGEEKRKTLDLLLAHPVPRGRVVLEKFASTLSGLVGLGAVLLVSVLVGARLVDMDISTTGLVAICLGCVLLAASIGAFAMAVGAATGKKGLAIAVASSVATASYFVNSLAPQIDALEPVQKISPFYYYIGGDPIVNGVPWVDFLVLVAVTAAALAVAVLMFQRRDIGI
jgi:ABC-2 type transport system permease protein